MIFEQLKFPTKAHIDEISRKADEQQIIKSTMNNEEACNRLFELSVAMMSSEKLYKDSNTILRYSHFAPNGKLCKCTNYDHFLREVSNIGVKVKIEDDSPDLVTYDPIKKTLIFDSLLAFRKH